MANNLQVDNLGSNRPLLLAKEPDEEVTAGTKDNATPASKPDTNAPQPASKPDTKPASKPDTKPASKPEPDTNAPAPAKQPPLVCSMCSAVMQASIQTAVQHGQGVCTTACVAAVNGLPNVVSLGWYAPYVAAISVACSPLCAAATPVIKKAGERLSEEQVCHKVLNKLGC